MQSSRQAQNAPYVTVFEGIVLWFKPLLSYGFIQFDGDRTLFFHRDQINAPVGYRHLTAGDFVSFEIGEDFKGSPSALRVTRIETIGGAR
jgi:cold shock CspA family protein